MRKLNQLIIYKFCTLGGVEKCLLTRAFLYKKYTLPLMISVCFLNENYSSMNAFRKYIITYGLGEHIQIVPVDGILTTRYDIVSSIDTPEAFEWFDTILAECHTGYPNNRKYLNNLPKNIEKIITPSTPFSDFLIKNHPIDSDIVFVLPNFIIKESTPPIPDKIWNKKIVFYYGRLDNLKNYHELISIFQACKKLSNDFLFYIMSPSLPELRQVLNLNTTLKNDLILSDGVPYTQMNQFLALMKRHQWIYVSASRQESFGLATAEALVHELPVVLADNPTHRYLVQDRTEFLYPLGDPAAAAEKIIQRSKHYKGSPEIASFLTVELAKNHLNKARMLFGL